MKNPLCFNNQATQGNGGAVYASNLNCTKISLSVFSYNQAQDGGAVYNYNSQLNLVNNLFYENEASSNGGAIYHYDNQNPSDSVIINNNTISDNRAGVGGGIYSSDPGSLFRIVNTIIWNNTPKSLCNNLSNMLPCQEFSYCCIDDIRLPDLANRNGNSIFSFNQAPNFIGNGNYMISYLPNVANKESSCYNTGDNSVSYIAQYDLAGNDRINNNEQIDIGAYEDPYFYGDICYYNGTNVDWGSGIKKDYIVSGPIDIPSGCLCTISEETTIAFKEDTYLEVNGTITAEGTDLGNNAVTFTAYDQGIGWLGIKIDGNNSNNKFEYCIFENVKKTAGAANDFTSSGSVYLEQSNNTSFFRCIFSNNSVSHSGGGLFFWEATANITDCYFYDNSTTGNTPEAKGGGVFIQFPGSSGHSVAGCIFNNNTANAGGGGIAIHSAGEISITTTTFSQNITNTVSPLMEAGGGAILILTKDDDVDVTIHDCQFTDNKAINNLTYSNGGGILAYNYDPSNYMLKLEISNSFFSSNEADVSGGGIFLYDIHEDVVIHSNYIQDNISRRNGGGIYMNNLSYDPIIYNNLITGNTATGDGGGIYMDESNPQIINCTVADNTATNGTGGGTYNTTTGNINPHLYNTIVYFNDPDNTIYNGSLPDPQHQNIWNNDIDGWSGNPGNFNLIDIDPGFKDLQNGDFRISYDEGTQCIDAGDDARLPAGLNQYDIRGTGYDRIKNLQVDIGAYEYEHPVPPGQYDPYYKKTGNDSIFAENIHRDMIVFPNPAKHRFTILFNSEVDETMNISLLNSVGQIVLSKLYEVNKGENSFYIERETLSAGCYFLQLNSATLNSKRMVLIFK